MQKDNIRVAAHCLLYIWSWYNVIFLLIYVMRISHNFIKQNTIYEKRRSPPMRHKKRPRNAFIGLRQIRRSLPTATSAHTGFFFFFRRVNRINYNYYDHHSLSVMLCKSPSALKRKKKSRVMKGRYNICCWEDYIQVIGALRKYSHIIRLYETRCSS